MKKNVSKVYRYNNNICVYKTDDNPEMIYKDYMYVSDSYQTIDELKTQRKKLLSMKKREEWPGFLVRPTIVEKFNKDKFTVGYPFINGIPLLRFLRLNNIDIKTCANFIKNMEKSVINEEKFVFPDIANPGNIIVLSNKNDNISFKVVDPDDVQFDGYISNKVSSLVSPIFEPLSSGMNKCVSGNIYNKQLDLRSMYALLYFIFNGGDFFYPILRERKNLGQYEQVLKSFNIPENSSLYEKSMNTLDEKKINEPIGDSIFELIERGYEFEISDYSEYGYCHCLVKK